MSAVAGVTALVGAVKSLTNAFKGALDNYAHFEKMEMGLTTFFQDAEKGKKQFEEIRKLSNETTFGVDELADSFTQLANVGINTNTIKDKLVMLGNLASGDKAKFAELTSIYAKIQSTGKAGAMQLQQIASRGIPIYDILKKMGVQGTATGEQITKAFEQMTEEGGQFYNAMENINETIEGKEGFIADYFKEFTVNFAEVSGIADAYKNTLDILKEKIGAVSDKLLEWNNNPIAKAILRGTLVAGVTALTVAIGVGLVGAISTLNKKLAITATLKAIINPTAVALTVGISAVLGLATALETATTQAGKYVDKIKEIQEEEKKNQYGLNDVDLEKAYKNKSKGTASTKELLAIARKERSEAEINAKILQEQTSASGGKYYQSYVDAEKKVKAKKQEYEIIEQIYQREVGIYKADEKTVNAIKDQVTEFDEFVNKLGDAEKNYSSIFKKEQELKEIEIERKKYLDFMNKQFFGTEMDASGHRKALSLTKEQKEQYEKDLETINKKYEELNIEVRIGNLSEVEQNLQKVLGLSNKEVYKLDPTKNNQNDWVEKYIQNYLNKQKVVKEAYKYANINQGTQSKTYVLQEVQAVKSMIEQLASINLEGKYNDAIESLTTYLDELGIEFESLGGSTKDLNEALGNSAKDFSSILNDMVKEAQNGNYGNYFAGKMGQQLMSSSKDASNFAQGFAEGGILGAVLNTLIGAFTEVAGSCEGFDKAMNPITNMMYVAKEPIQKIVSIIAKGADTVQLFGLLLEDFLNTLAPIFDIIFTVGSDLSEILFAIGDQLKPIYSILTLLFTAFKALYIPVHLVTKGLSALFEWLSSLPIVGDIIGSIDEAVNDLGNSIDEVYNQLDKEMDDWSGMADKKREAEEKYNKATNQSADDLKNATKDLTGEYKSLLDAMKENEEWYLRQKTALNANTRKEAYSVNDMILTPQGAFSTHPDDYIIATKNPQSLGGGGAVFNMKIDNTVANDVEVTAQAQDNGTGGQDILVMISRKIASDVANGANGWDSATSGKNSRLAGRRVLL